MSCVDISVIVTIFNKEDYIEQCIESICKQTKKNIEIILVNDGSTDHSLSIIQKFASTDRRILVVNQENKGLTEARIAGYKVSTGKYVCWIDADDFIKPEMLKELYDIAREEKADLVYCDYECFPHEVISKAKWFSEYKGNKDWEFLDKNTEFWNKLFSKELLEKTDIIQMLRNYGEYSPIVPMLEAHKIAFTKEKLYIYRVGHNSMSGGSLIGKTKHYYDGAICSKGLKQIIINKPYEKKLNDYFDYRYIYTLLLLSTVSARNSDRKMYLFAYKELKELDYQKNPLIDIIVKKHYGKIKAIVLTRLIPRNYFLAKIITMVVFP